MANKPDWADEVSWALSNLDEDNRDEREFKTKQIAAAIRKAKADGMREAAELMESMGAGADVFIHVIHLALVLDEAADKIERGEV